ncbi:hypothetical protein ACOME3_006929, partial [Neoechinorhynchus agilis]
NIIECVRDCCLAHDAEEIDTPCFELRDVLSNKYGEEQKLIYNLEDFEGELLSLRYDLTVPFARYLASSRVLFMRRFQVGKVFRRDNPKMTRGRLREFYQCDFDIAGKFGPMITDAEIILLASRVMDRLNMPDYVIKLNHRNILKGILIHCGVKESQIKTVCSSVDKLDKKPWIEIHDELIQVKGISQDVVERIGIYIEKRPDDITGIGLLDRLRTDTSLKSSKIINQGLDDIELLLKYLEAFGILNRIQFDYALARGLDYYTGVIYEVVLKNFEVSGEDGGSVGTVAAGGRYDDLVRTIAGREGINVPCIGISFGIERMVTVLKQRLDCLSEKRIFRTVETEVYVATAQSGFIIERLQLLKMLLDNGIKVAYSAKSRPKFLDQIQYCEQRNIPFCLIIGQSEIEQGVVKLKDVNTRVERLIKREELIDEVRRLVKDFRIENNKEMVMHGFSIIDRL